MEAAVCSWPRAIAASFQGGVISLIRHGSQDGGALAPLAVPARFTFAPQGTPKGEPANVGQMYALFIEAIGGKHTNLPDFSVALRLHQLLDAIREASLTGRAISFG